MTPETRSAVRRVRAFLAVHPSGHEDARNDLIERVWADHAYELWASDLCLLLAAADPDEQHGTATGCPHCPDGHPSPDTRPWAVWVTETRVDGQPPHLMAAPTNCAHVAESDAEWLRDAIRRAKADRHAPLTDEPSGVIPTPRGRQAALDYRATRRQQHPKAATDA